MIFSGNSGRSTRGIYLVISIMACHWHHTSQNASCHCRQWRPSGSTPVDASSDSWNYSAPTSSFPRDRAGTRSSGWGSGKSPKGSRRYHLRSDTPAGLGDPDLEPVSSGFPVECNSHRLCYRCCCESRALWRVKHERHGKIIFVDSWLRCLSGYFLG